MGANPTAGAVPCPLSGTLRERPPAVSATDSVPVRAPEAVGVKVTLIEQLAPAAKVAGLVGQALAPVLVAAKSPEAAKEVIVKAAVPVERKGTRLNARHVESTYLLISRHKETNHTAGAVPVALSGNVWWLPTELSVTHRAPVPTPMPYTTLFRSIEQLAPAAKVAGLVGQALAPVLVAAKSPEAAKEVIVKAAVP